jgi:hypothetical protein
MQKDEEVKSKSTTEKPVNTPEPNRYQIFIDEIVIKIIKLENKRFK